MDPQLLLFCCLVCLEFLVASCFQLAVLWFRVSNLLAMAPQPAFDGLQPKSEDLQL